MTLPDLDPASPECLACPKGCKPPKKGYFFGTDDAECRSGYVICLKCGLRGPRALLQPDRWRDREAVRKWNEMVRRMLAPSNN